MTVELAHLQRDMKIYRRIATAKLESLKSAFQMENEKLTDIQSRLEACRIYAPREGVVVYPHNVEWDFNIEEGQTVKTQMTIAQVVNVDKLELKLLVSNSQMHRVQAGQTAEIRFHTEPYKLHTGIVTHVNERAEHGWRRDRKYEVILSLKERLNQAKLGMRGSVTINTSDDNSDSVSTRPGR